jgi:O-antigen/teichoic acid export membrane protein
MMAFLNTVMTSTTYRFIAFEMGKENTEGINRVFNTSLVIHICIALFVLFFVETAGVYYIKHFLNITADKQSDALFVLRLSTYATVISIFSIPYQGLVTAQEKFSTQATIEIIRSVLNFLVAITIMNFIGNRLRLYSFLILLASTIPSVLFFVYCKLKFREIVRWNLQRGIREYKEMLGYTGWLMFGTAAWVGQRQGSDLIINIFFGTLLNAALGIANQLNSIVLMFARNIGQAAIPQITKSVSSENSERTKTLVAYISKYSCFLFLLPALPIFLEINFLLKLWLGNYPPYAEIFCKLLIINALIESLSSGIPSVIMATGKVKYFMIIGGLISLISLPIAYMLFKIGFPPYTILLIYILNGTINLVVNQVLLKRIINFNVSFFMRTAYLKILYVLVLVTPLFFIHDLFPAGLSRFIIFSVIAVCWLITVIYFVGIDKQEKNIISQTFVKIFIRN